MNNKDKIILASYDSCTGCSACVSICPTSSITMLEDKEGFLQPHVDNKRCIYCHKCEKNCPILHPLSIPTDFETTAYAAINKDDEVRMRSSSGGIFHALAKWIIQHEGVVFGARFNEKWEVIHDYTETVEGIEPFMRSKYVQSNVGNTYKQAKQFLDKGIWVLYSGTPCQIGGLKSFLKTDYEKLLTVDLICHGVPSPKVWRKYLQETFKNEKILSVNFRSKDNGWMQSQPKIVTLNRVVQEEQLINPYYRGFLRNAFLRRSCFQCIFRKYHRNADFTIADYWGVDKFYPELFDDKGTSIVFVHTNLGNIILSELSNYLNIQPQKKDVAIKYNQGMERDEPLKDNRMRFFRLFSILPFRYSQHAAYKDAFTVRVRRKVMKLLKNKISH